MSNRFDQLTNIHDLTEAIAAHLDNSGRDVFNEPRVPKGSGRASGEWTRGSSGGGSGGSRVTQANWVMKEFATKEQRDDAQAILGKLTNGALSAEQMDSLIDQVLGNISRSDLRALQEINPNATPIELTPQQTKIIQHQIDKLSPDLRADVKKQFDNALEKGTGVCPKCTV